MLLNHSVFEDFDEKLMGDIGAQMQVACRASHDTWKLSGCEQVSGSDGEVECCIFGTETIACTTGTTGCMRLLVALAKKAGLFEVRLGGNFVSARIY